MAAPGDHDAVRIGHFRVVGELGRGGMGSVLIGVDDKIGRRVALKVILPEQRLDPVRKARFLREARVLSTLDHPHVCKFHDFIEGEDQDCLVLELVEGRNLREAMDAGLDRAARMTIAMQLLEVLVAVHGKGVIHRDLKPENIMLTPDCGIKVLDFGLARPVDDAGSLSGEFLALRPDPDDADAGGADEPARVVPAGRDDPSKTRFGTVLGTIGYMSPEVARGEPATAASDLYSAGMILHELFTGRPPIPLDLPAAERHRRAMWAELEPVDGLPAELTILIRRLESLVPESRPTAIDAAGMLRHHAERPRRVRRRRVVAAMWTVLALFGAGMTVQYLRAEHATRRAEAEAATAREVSDFLVGLFEQASPRIAQGEEISVADLLARGAETVDASLEGQPEIQAKMLHTLGTVYYQMGRFDEAGPLLDDALALRREHLTPDDPELADSLRASGLLARALGRYDHAEALLTEALEVVVAVGGSARSLESARLLIDLSAVDQDRGRWEAAEGRLLEAVAVLGRHPDGVAAGLTDALFDLAALYRKLDRLPEAERAIERCLELDEEAFGPRSENAAGDLTELAALAAMRGDLGRAEELARRSLEIRIEVLGDDHPNVAHSACALGFVLVERERYAEADESFQLALEVYRRALGEDHPFVGSVLHSLGRIAARQGELDRAAELLEASIEITAAAKGSDHPLVADSQRELASVWCEQGRTEDALRLFERALEVLEATLAPDHATLERARKDYADCRRAAG
jgi:serine/threonine-protein kinase